MTHPTTSFELVGSPAIVTGGAQGIGFEIDRQLVDQGADLIVADWAGVFDFSEKATRSTRSSRGARSSTSTTLNYGEWITGMTIHTDGGMHLNGVPDNWEIMKGPLGLSDPTPADWASWELL